MSTDDEIEAETIRITRNGQVTIPERFREEYSLYPGEELAWMDSDVGLVLRKATCSAGRGKLVDADVDETTRAAMAEEMDAFVYERRRTEWAPE